MLALSLVKPTISRGYGEVRTRSPSAMKKQREYSLFKSIKNTGVRCGETGGTICHQTVVHHIAPCGAWFIATVTVVWLSCN
jgi:hypothetical protein